MLLSVAYMVKIRADVVPCVKTDRDGSVLTSD